MTLEAGRKAIEAYWTENWVMTPSVLTDQPFTPANGMVALSIQDGDRMQGSIGRVRNVVNNMGLLVVRIYTPGEEGKAGANIIAQAVIEMLERKSLDASGRFGNPTVVRFSPPELGLNCEPYIAAQTLQAPYRVTNINAPFVRYELR